MNLEAYKALNEAYKAALKVANSEIGNYKQFCNKLKKKKNLSKEAKLTLSLYEAKIKACEAEIELIMYFISDIASKLKPAF